MNTLAGDLAPLSQRLGVLQLFRVAAALAVLIIPALADAASESLVPLAIAYAALTAALELMRRRAGPRVARFLSAMLLLDAAFLAAATTLTGGAGSPLLFLMFLDVLAVTLLASYRDGLKIAIWCALLLFLGQAAIEAGWITSAEPSSDGDIALGAVAFVVVAGAAAAFSAVNERALRVSRGHLAALVDLDAELARATACREIAAALARCGTEQLGFSRVAVVTDGADGRLATVATASPSPRPECWPCGPLEGRELEPAPDGWHLVQALDPAGTFASLLPDARRVVVVPLEVDDARVGALAAEWGGRARNRIPALTVQALAQAAAHAALSIRHLVLLAEIERLATEDPLTGLANRRVFDETLERELQRSKRTGDPVTVVLVDVDHFKRVNDELGHAAGDALLQALATAVRADIRGFDLAARWGGDEFAFILPGSAAEDAPNVAGRLRTTMARAVDEPPITVSAGWATAPDHGDDAPALLDAADAALYAAKRSGRDRVGSPVPSSQHRVGTSGGRVA